MNTDKQTEAMKQALEALEQIAGAMPFPVGKQAITALRRALEQPAQQEPVAWATQLGEYAHIQWGAKRPEYPMVYEFPLYTRPQAREPLTDEQETKAALWDLAVSKGLITIHSEQLAPRTWSAHLSVVSWIEGHNKACDISNEAAHGIGEKK